MGIIASALSYIRSEDTEYRRSVSENILTKVGASINYILDNAQLTDPQLYGQVFTASGNFTVPAGVTRVKVTVIGGGGNGGAATGISAAGGGGGGGGGSVRTVSGLTPLSIVVVTVGAAGGTSSFGAHCSATGGSAGGTTGVGGAGGLGSSGDINLYGGTGEGVGGISYNRGGDSALNYGHGENGTLVNDNNGTAGKVYGGGGGGSGPRDISAVVGGAGAAGVVIVEWVA